MKRIAILYICTGKYTVFWKDFYESYEKNFVRNCRKDYFVFTDSDALTYAERDNVHIIYQELLGWPYDTLNRFHFFAKIENQLKEFDYIFFMNANMLCREEIVAEEILPQDKDIVVIRHPGFWDKSNDEYTYDRNPKSQAYMGKQEGKYYVCGGINGGKAIPYLELIKELRRRVDIDSSNDVIALWHDESHLNKYVWELGDDKCLVLSPAYGYPEGWKLPFVKKLEIREKSKYINVKKVKGETPYKKIVGWCRKRWEK